MGRHEKDTSDATNTDDSNSPDKDEPKGGRPGPVDGGGGGGMATRENAPEIADKSS